MNIKGNVENYWRVGFWGLFSILLAVCAYFMIHGAWWIIGDEAIVVSHVGMGVPFSPTGFEAAPSQGRLYPFAYNLYNVLLLFNPSYNTPQDIYILHSVALTIFAVFFALIGLHILREKPAVWRYSISLGMVVIAVARVFPEFITCYTGAWIIYMFLPIFLYCTIRFDESEHWGWGIVALLTINYITYCYENVCTIPFAIGVCSLLFNYRNLSRNKKIFNYLLIAGVLVFFGIWAIVVLPQVTDVYQHVSDYSHWMNAFKIFIAQKIYWLAIVCFLVRLIQILRKKCAYTIYDTLLLSSLAYFLGTAILKLNFTYYYNVGALIALVSILYFGKEYMSSRWLLLLFFVLAVFYGRKIPSSFHYWQGERAISKSQITHVADLSNTMSLHWYAPYYEDQTNMWADFRSCQKSRLEAILQWYMHNKNFKTEVKEDYDASSGLWLFPRENEKLFPDMELPKVEGEKVLDTRGIKGYIVNCEGIE